MSTQKHNAYRKILNIERFTTDYEGQQIKCKAIMWCLVSELTPRTVKTNHIGLTVYVDSFKCTGIEAWHPRKLTSINLKNPMESKFIKEHYNPKFDLRKPFGQAYRRFILSNPKRALNRKGIVTYFDKLSGEGMIYEPLTDTTYHIAACNIKGKKTWFPNTACMYLKKNEEVEYDLADMGDHLTPNNVRGDVYLDEEKWDRIKDRDLAFRCDEAGHAITGLFKEDL